MGPPKLPGAPWPGLGRPRKSTPEGNNIEPRGDQNGVREASGGLLGARCAPDGRPGRSETACGSCGPLAGSRGRLGEPLAPLGALLGLPGGSPEARWGALGGHFGTYFEGRPREPGKSQCFGISSGLVASTFAAVFGRLLPSLWRARRRRVP